MSERISQKDLIEFLKFVNIWFKRPGENCFYTEILQFTPKETTQLNRLIKLGLIKRDFFGTFRMYYSRNHKKNWVFCFYYGVLSFMDGFVFNVMDNLTQPFHVGTYRLTKKGENIAYILLL